MEVRMEQQNLVIEEVVKPVKLTKDEKKKFKTISDELWGWWHHSQESFQQAHQYL
jgi:hypothetical protein